MYVSPLTLCRKKYNKLTFQTLYIIIVTTIKATTDRRSEGPDQRITERTTEKNLLDPVAVSASVGDSLASSYIRSPHIHAQPGPQNHTPSSSCHCIEII